MVSLAEVGGEEVQLLLGSFQERESEPDQRRV